MALYFCEVINKSESKKHSHCLNDCVFFGFEYFFYGILKKDVSVVFLTSACPDFQFNAKERVLTFLYSIAAILSFGHFQLIKIPILVPLNVHRKL